MKRICTLLALAAMAACAPKGGDAPTTPPPTTPPAAPTPAPAPEPSGDAAKGAALYAGTCIACHGADATGVPGLGKDLTDSAFIRGQTDTQLAAFLKVGRGSTDPENTTGIDMPPKGGNPALSASDLVDIAVWLHTLEPATEEG